MFDDLGSPDLRFLFEQLTKFFRQIEHLVKRFSSILKDPFANLGFAESFFVPDFNYSVQIGIVKIEKVAFV